MLTFAWPRHSWGDIGLMQSALVAAVARSKCTRRPFFFGADAGIEALVQDDIAVDRVGIERLLPVPSCAPS